MRASYFDDEFYPTPTDLIAKMVEPYIKKSVYKTYLQDLVFCDPCAGNGAIIDYLNELSVDKADIYCFERDQDLQAILQQKDCTFLGPDFLQYKGDLHFDVLLINPPFSKGDDFLLHAWDLMEQGHITCLLNAQTLSNPYTQKRKLLAKIIEDFGKVEHLGSAFVNSDRFTNVEVVMVRLEKKAKSRFDFEFESVANEKAFNLSEDNIFDLPATRDVIGNMELQFDKLRETFVSYLEVRKSLEFYSAGLLSQYNSMEKILDNVGLNGSRSYNKFSGKIRKDMWMNVISKMGMERYMTSALKKNFSTFSQQQSKLDFTKANVQELIKMILLNRNDILENAITEVFDAFTAYHKENRLHVEGWKTNDSWKVNRRIVLPDGVKYGEYMSAYDLKQYGDRFSVSSSKDIYEDIDKALCFITGDTYENITTIKSSLKSYFDKLGKIHTGDKFDNTCESSFFEIKFFKKGTIHLHFKSESLWQEFNLRACAGKQWLPEEDLKKWQRSKEKKENTMSENQECIQLLLMSA